MAILFSFLLLLSHIGSPANAASELAFDSIYQFGDSIADTGNIMRENHFPSCSLSPYGETFFRKPTGRCSDGLLMVDFFARAFKIPLLSPYLDKDGNFSHGVNFAVAGATALNASFLSSHTKKSVSTFPHPPPGNSLATQLGWFRNHVSSVCSSSSDCKRRFERALFVVGEVGGNDYNYLLWAGQSTKDLENLVPAVVQTIANAVKEVIVHGATEVVVPGNFPIGCLPIYLTTRGSNDANSYDDLGCLRSMNEFARFHNHHLLETIRSLQKQHPSVAIRYGDYYSAFTWVLRNAASLGFEEDGLFKPCCGAMNHLCGSKGCPVCSDPRKRISWDGIHMTQETYRNMAHWLLSDTFSRNITCCSEPSEEQQSIGDSISMVQLRY